MGYRSDRQRVEALLIPQMFLGVLICGVNDPDHPDAKTCQERLIQASEEAFSDLREPERSKIIRRAHRTHLEVTAPYQREGHRVDKMGLIVFFLVKAITDCDYMIIGPESSLQRALDLMLPALEPSTEIGPLLDSAQASPEGSGPSATAWVLWGRPLLRQSFPWPSIGEWCILKMQLISLYGAQT